MNYEELRALPILEGRTIIGDTKLEDYGLVPMTSEEISEIMVEVFGYLL